MLSYYSVPCSLHHPVIMLGTTKKNNLMVNATEEDKAMPSLDYKGWKNVGSDTKERTGGKKKKKWLHEYYHCCVQCHRQCFLGPMCLLGFTGIFAFCSNKERERWDDERDRECQNDTGRQRQCLCMKRCHPIPPFLSPRASQQHVQLKGIVCLSTNRSSVTQPAQSAIIETVSYMRSIYVFTALEFVWHFCCSHDGRFLHYEINTCCSDIPQL